MYTNKDIIEKLDSYFQQQDPKIVSRMAANFIIDLNRFLSMSDMTNQEADDLIRRTSQNINAIFEFIESGDQSPLELYRWKKED